MSKNVIGIAALALATIGCLAIATGATARGAKLQSEGANQQVMRMDACPYYPSPVFCRDASTAYARTSGT
jgi:hypothetical protein